MGTARDLCFETQLGTNHLGHFVLVNRLAPWLLAGSRVVVLSSGAHRMSDIDLEDLNFERRAYDAGGAYGQSKTANALFAVEFDRRHKDRGVRAVADGMRMCAASRECVHALSPRLGARVATRCCSSSQRAYRDKETPKSDVDPAALE